MKNNKYEYTLESIKELEFLYSFVNIDKNKNKKKKLLRNIRIGIENLDPDIVGDIDEFGI